ncbi:MAG TPA: M20/M25/M40 family metallo-hydrolase [Streptosporangiaceae bacterium]
MDDFDLDWFLDAARGLLAIPSTADRPAELHRALEYVLDFVGPGFTVQRFESGGKPSALVYAPGPAAAPATAPATASTTASTARPGPIGTPQASTGQRWDDQFTIILNGHLDVVPAAADQFVARRDGDRLYARGAQDMKVSALAEALAFRELAATLPDPVALQLVTDEETGGRNGTRHQLERGVRGQFVIIGETSGLRIVTDSKGMLGVTLRSAGRGAHSAYQWLGDNALVKLMRSVDRVLARYPVATAEEWRTTVNLARVHTPNQARNQIPAEAEAWLDIRFPSEDRDFNERSAPEVAAYLQSFCEPGVTAVINSLDAPHHTDRDRPEIPRLQAAALAQRYQPDFLRKHGAGDGRFYGSLGIAAVAFGVGGQGQHGADEYAEISTIEPYYRALRQFLSDPD